MRKKFMNNKNFDKQFYSNLFDKLFPINRSIMGEGYRKSLLILNKYINLKLIKFRSGKKIFDWTIPHEWKINEAYILTPDNKKICDFKKNNLFVLNYSDKINKKLSLFELKKILNSNKALPDAIPYTFSYYKKKVGFNISYNEKKKLKKGFYRVIIDSKFKKGDLVIGEKILKGKSNKDFLISSYLCHPSMANNELSGPLILLGLYQRIQNWNERKYNYRFVINPETIGSLSYLYKYKKNIKKKLVAGLVLTCLGGPNKKISIKKPKNELADLNKFIDLFSQKKIIKSRNYDPIVGSDERQYCSPGFNLPVGQAAKTIYRNYKEYHTSLDNKNFLKIENIKKTVDELEYFLKFFDRLNGKIKRKNKFGEVFLHKYDLYKNKNTNNLTKTIIHILSCGENQNELIDLIIQKKLSLKNVIEAIDILEKKKIITIKK
ncbi:DUF4910 domain-containing protein [Pelagibacterales bacterium SAG-MED38]|nr:DUF4910 domain-containing protein [Pelagibacterales bacterium SAG-MED38]